MDGSGRNDFIGVPFVGADLAHRFAALVEIANNMYERMSAAGCEPRVAPKCRIVP